MGIETLPTSASTVARYMVVHHQTGASVATLRASATAIGQADKAAGHPSPVAEEVGRLTIACIVRTNHRSQSSAASSDAVALVLLVADANLRRSKTDATGSGTVVYTTPRMTAALEAIQLGSGDDEGLVFAGLDAAQISRRIAAGRPPTPDLKGITPAAAAAAAALVWRCAYCRCHSPGAVALILDGGALHEGR